MVAILHDIRLEGVAPIAEYNLNVGGGSAIHSALANIKNYAISQTGPIELEIMCHGYETHSDPIRKQSTEKSIGGGGLHLCKEDIGLKNVHITAALAGYVSKITVYACGVANTHKGYINTNFDGQKLFKQMSEKTNAVIYAADVTQWYFRNENPTNSSDNTIDFKGFEGNLWEFTPDKKSRIVQRNQLEAH